MDEQEQWTAKDVIPGGLFLAAGLLVLLYALLAMANGAPFVLWGPGVGLGPLLLILGGNAIYRGIRSGESPGRPPDKPTQTDGPS